MTTREQIRETIENYTEEYLNELASRNNFIGIWPDGDINEIDYDISASDECDADDMREAMTDFLDGLEEGFFDDEDGDSLMAEIVENDVCWEMGADATLLESYEQKMSLLEYVRDYGVTENTKDNMDEYDWDIATRRLDLNRRFNGKIYSTCKWNSENMTFCLDWDAPEDCLQAGAIDINELEELKEDIENGDVVFWTAEGDKLLTGNEAQSAAIEWLNSHDVTERMKHNSRESYWKKLTDKLGLTEDYHEYIYYTENGCSWNPENIMLLTVLPSQVKTYKFGIALNNGLTTEYKDFESDNQAEEYGKQILGRENVESLQIYREVKAGYLYITTL